MVICMLPFIWTNQNQRKLKKVECWIKVLNQANLLSETCYDGMACQYKGRIKTHYAMFCITEMFKNID